MQEDIFEVFSDIVGMKQFL